MYYGQYLLSLKTGADSNASPLIQKKSYRRCKNATVPVFGSQSETNGQEQLPTRARYLLRRGESRATYNKLEQ